MTSVTRPRGVRLIAWAWILTGAVNGVSALGGLFTAGLLQGLSAQVPPASRTAAAFPLFLVHHAAWFAVLQIALAVVAVLAGIDFLRLRAWARSVLEALSWLSLAYLASGAVYWWRFWDAFTASGSFAGMAVDLAPYRTPGLILVVVLVVGLAVPLGLMIRTLRARAVREAVAGAAPGPRRPTGVSSQREE